jgi:hypothetical protein
MANAQSVTAEGTSAQSRDAGAEMIVDCSSATIDIASSQGVGGAMKDAPSR